MKKLGLLMVALFATSAMAQDENMITLNASDYQVGGTFTILEDELNVGDPTDTNTLNFAINYARKFSEQWQLRGLAKVSRAKIENNDSSEKETVSYQLAAGPVFNIGNQIKDSFYIGLMLGLDMSTREDTAANGTSTERDGLNTYAEIDFGKRFDIGDLGPVNFAYSPGLSYQVYTYGGDFDDIDGRDSKNTITFHLIRLDVLW